jgi:hypothetical protein
VVVTLRVTSHHAERDVYFILAVCGVVVYYSQESNEVAGSLIKGVRGFCERILQTMPGFKIEIKDRRVRLVHIFRAQLWTSKINPNNLATLTYEKLIQVAEESEVETEMCLA